MEVAEKMNLVQLQNGSYLVLGPGMELLAQEVPHTIGASKWQVRVRQQRAEFPAVAWVVSTHETKERAQAALGALVAEARS